MLDLRQATAPADPPHPMPHRGKKSVTPTTAQSLAPQARKVNAHATPARHCLQNAGGRESPRRSDFPSLTDRHR